MNRVKLEDCFMANSQGSVAGISAEELQKLASKGPEKGIPGLVERLLTSCPAELPQVLGSVDLGIFREGKLADTPAETGKELLAANLETLRALPGLGATVESACRTRRQRLEKAWKQVDAARARQAFQEVEDLCLALVWLHRHDALGSYEKGEDTLLADDATGSQLQETVALLFGPKPEKGLLSEAVSADGVLRQELCLRAAALFCVSQFVLEGGKIFLESIHDRRKHNLLERQYLAIERIEDVCGARLSRGELGLLESGWDAALQAWTENHRIALKRDRCVAYLKFLGTRHNAGAGGRLPPEHIRACQKCGVHHRWVGMRCRVCGFLFCRDCAPKGADGVCLGCVPPKPATETASAGAEAGSEGPSVTTAAETRLPNTEEETVSSYKEALRKIFKGKVATVEHGIGVVTCCGRELRLQKFSLMDGTLGFVECPGCHKAHYTK